ncbi:TonB-dependent receptor [Herbaspirillum camelliae]|uniref:TonB-dependent receptor n=1 Tax=Herbaspirillum camelliae TaxID=1892903 RepID=UPI000B2075C6|nr:TonB-dependent receptor [Herbaspirillum camelliae]
MTFVAARRRRARCPDHLHRVRPLVRATALSGLLAFSAVPDALAQTTASSEDSALTLGTVEVSGRRSGPLQLRNVLTSVDLIGADRLQQQQVLYNWELFAQSPGVMLTQFRQGNESGKLSFRGFNGEGEVNAVKLLIDGVPSNDNAGGMPFLGTLFPLDMAGIEVVRGTNDARYGLHNIAGNVNILTRQGGTYDEARVTYGSFNTRQVQVAKGVENGNWSQNYFLGYEKSDGYREHAQAENIAFSGKWFYTSDDGRYRTGLSIRHANAYAQEPGYLTAQDARVDPRASYAYAQSDGGNRQLDQVSLHFDGDIDDQLSVGAKLYLNRVRDQRWLRYSSTTSQQERLIDETHYGLMTTATYRPRWKALEGMSDLALEGGLNVERQEDQSPRFSTVNKVRVTQTRDHHFTFDTFGAYLQAVIKPVESFKIIPGYRVDKVGGSFTDPSRGVSYGIQNYGVIKQPKLSVVYAPIRQASLYANWGRTFQVGAGAAAYKSNNNDLRPSINDGWESGVKFTPVEWLDGRLAWWEQRASDEVKRRLNDPTGDSENVGRTKRSGVDLQLNLRAGKRTTMWLAYSRQRSEIITPDPSAPATIGKEIDHVPRYLFSGGVDYQATVDLKLSTSFNGQGSYYLTTANTGGKFGGYTLINASASYQVSPTLALELQVKNLANRYYEYVWINDQTRHAPGDGRAVYLSANLKY